MTERGPSFPAERGGPAVLVLALVRGVLAAGLGLGCVAVLVVVLWISSPDPGSGPGEALHAAAGLWLLAHGAELVRTETLTGTPAPVGVVPLLLTVVPLWLLHRAARGVCEPEEEGEAPSAGAAFALVTAGYLLVGGVVALYARGASLSARPLTLLFPGAFVVAGAAASGVWRAAGRPLGPPPSWAPVRLHEAMARTRFVRRVRAAGRSAAAGTAVLVGGGALVVAVSLAWHGAPVEASFLGLSDDWAGRFAVLLLALSLVPNAAVWGAAYGLGPGFALGTGATVTPLAFTGTPSLPDFPLLAALPAPGPGTFPNWAAAGVPLAAALTVAWFTVRRAAPAHGAREEAWGPWDTALTAALGAGGCAVGAALLAAAAGGPLGVRALAVFGPVWWATGAAALAWTLMVSVPAALLLRAWRLRGRDPYAEDGDDLDAEESGAPAPATAPVPAAADVAADGPAEDRAAPRRWWSWRGRRTGGPEAEGDGDAASVPVPRPAPATARGEADDDVAVYDFLPVDPWHARTRPPEPRPEERPAPAAAGDEPPGGTGSSS
ncbi:cell division protein PerM [Streptomyces sp. NPDC001515]